MGMQSGFSGSASSRAAEPENRFASRVLDVLDPLLGTRIDQNEDAMVMSLVAEARELSVDVGATDVVHDEAVPA